MKRQEEIEEILLDIDRKGIEDLLHWMEHEGFYEAPASTRFHNVYTGGLADHSWDVYSLLLQYDYKFRLKLDLETASITGLLHDICKVGLYIPEGNKYTYNKAHAQGHGSLSVSTIKRFIELTVLEEKMIRYHMGPYGCHEFDERTGEYPLRGGGLANAWYHYPAVKVIYICDELATLQEKTKDS